MSSYGHVAGLKSHLSSLSTEERKAYEETHSWRRWLKIHLIGYGLVILLISCARYGVLTIETGFTSSEVELIDLAIDEWVRATQSTDAVLLTRTGYPKDEYLSYWTGYGYKVHKISRKDKVYAILRDEVGKDFCGGYSKNYGRFVIVSDCIKDPYWLYVVMMHELGHFYGIDHLSSGLMYNNPLVSCIDHEALDKFCDVNFCGDGAAPTCK